MQLGHLLLLRFQVLLFDVDDLHQSRHFVGHFLVGFHAHEAFNFSLRLGLSDLGRATGQLADRKSLHESVLVLIFFVFVEVYLLCDAKIIVEHAGRAALLLLLNLLLKLFLRLLDDLSLDLQSDGFSLLVGRRRAP